MEKVSVPNLPPTHLNRAGSLLEMITHVCSKLLRYVLPDELQVSQLELMDLHRLLEEKVAPHVIFVMSTTYCHCDSFIPLEDTQSPNCFDKENVSPYIGCSALTDQNAIRHTRVKKWIAPKKIKRGETKRNVLIREIFLGYCKSS